MNRRLLLLAAYVGLAIGNARAEEPLSRIGFGSCARQDKPQPIWDAVIAAQPQLFLLLGDNIYGDSPDMDVLREKYALLGNQPGFKKLRQTCPLLATWDDHDYGANDAGGEFAQKKASQQVFLDFLGAPADDIRRTREGVYSARIIGPPGKKVQVILLDQRYFRSLLTSGYEGGEPGEGVRGKYIPDTDPASTVLGETQWKWLEEQLQQPAEIRLIGASYQAVAADHGWECWGNFPLERKKLFRLIRETKAGGVVILSGDRHLAEMSRLGADDPDSVGYPLLDVTSSSLNLPSGNFTSTGVRYTNEINSHRVGLTYFDTNFGFVTIDWQPADPVIRVQVRDEKGGVVMQQRMKLSEMQGNK